MPKVRKVPMRMCVGCRQMKPKRELIRVVRPADGGDVRADRTGKLAGRGAYICASEECLKKARKARLLEKALETPISEQTYEQLSVEMERRELSLH
nr:YlxR family protein [bacterium]